MKGYRIALRETVLALALLSMGCDRYHAPIQDLETDFSGPACEGVCAVVAPLGWSGPTMIGRASSAPSCPSLAPIAGFEGYAGLLEGDLACPTCTCGPASCALPTTGRASSATCGGAGEGPSFGAPDGWEGTCATVDGIAPGASCGGAPCKALVIDPPTIDPCAPLEATPGHRDEPAWTTIARECLITLSDVCELEGTICAPPPPSGFALCVYQAGEVDTCPIEYSSRSLVFAGVEDARACSPCACGSPSGAVCSAYLEAFTDAACASPIAAVTVVEGEPSKCADLPVGAGLGSMRAELVDDTPGTCAPSGGELVGKLAPLGAVTLCCRPEDLAR